MRKYVKRSCMYLLSALMMMSLSGTPVGAAKKKLSVNKIYTTTTKVKGKTKGKYRVKIKLGQKTYSAKATKKGNYSIKIPKQKVGKSFYVKAYKGKKYYTKKKCYVLTKSISINKFSKTSKTIKGYARPKYKVRITINGKTYTKKASAVRGVFTIKLKKAAGNGTATVKLYNTKGKIVKTVKKKAYNTSSKPAQKPVQKAPGLEDAIDLAQVQKDIDQANKTGKDISKSPVYNGKYAYKYYVDGEYGFLSVGYIESKNDRWDGYGIQQYADGAEASITAKNGVTIYYNVSGGEGIPYEQVLKKMPAPTQTKADGVIKPGQKAVFKTGQYDTSDHMTLFFKAHGYKNGKLLFMEYSKLYLF